MWTSKPYIHLSQKVSWSVLYKIPVCILSFLVQPMCLSYTVVIIRHFKLSLEVFPSLHFHMLHYSEFLKDRSDPCTQLDNLSNNYCHFIDT